MNPSEPKPCLPGPHVKDKIGSHLSYPVKFSDLLPVLPSGFGPDQIQVWYRAWKAPRPGEVREKYGVLEAQYSHARASWSCPWTIYVLPVPRAYRSAVRRLLIPSAIERLRIWLHAGRTPVWFAGRHQLRILFVPAVEAFAYEEG